MGEAATQVRERRPILVVLAAAGLVGPIVFSLLVIVQGLLHPDYSHAALPISALAAWPVGWVQNVNFVVFGCLMSAYAIGLHLGIRPGPGGPAGSALLVLSGVGLTVAGVFPWRAADGAFVVPVGHIVGAFLAFLGAGSGLIVLSRRMAGDPSWRGLATYALVCGLSIIVLFVALFVLARVPDAPLYPWAGVVQRAAVAVWFACTVVLALRLGRSDRRAG